MNTHSSKAEHKLPPMHPIADSLLGVHDQDNYSMTDDGLICAPVGYYRILQQYGEKNPRITLAFAFTPEELALVPHPDNPDVKILKNPAYILKPRDPKTLYGSAEIMMRENQSDWLTFVLGFGNLYYSERKSGPGAGIYFSNNFIAYHIKPKYGASGLNNGYEISYQVNPYGKSYGLNFDEGAHEDFWKYFDNDSIHIATVKDGDEALQIIHNDFRTLRLPAFIEGQEVQDWTIKRPEEQPRNIMMWFKNTVNHYMEEPQTVWMNISRVAEVAGKLASLPALFGFLGSLFTEEGAEREKERLTNGTDLEDVADIDEDHMSPAPLHKMREKVVPHWMGITPQSDSPLFLKPISRCNNIETHRRAHMIDIIHDREPVLVTPYEGHDPGLVARTHHGIEVNYLDHGHKRYVAYAPCDAISCPTDLPSDYESLFSEEGIARITRIKQDEPLPPNHQVFHTMPGQPYRLIYCFEPLDEIKHSILNDGLIQSFCRYRMPKFVGKPSQAVADKNGISQKPLSSFQQYARALLHYGRLLAPGKAYGRKYYGGAWLFSVLGTTNAVTHTLEGGTHLAFTLAGALLTRHMAANALTKEGKTRLKAAAQAIYTAAFADFGAKAATTLLDAYHTEKLNIFKFKDHEVREYVLTLPFALGFGGITFKNLMSDLGDIKLSSPKKLSMLSRQKPLVLSQ